MISLTTEEEQKELAWRQSLQGGDEIAIEFNSPVGAICHIAKVTRIENVIVYNDNWDGFFIADGEHETGRGEGGEWTRMVQPTPERRERIDLVEEVEGRAGYAIQHFLFSYLPIEDLRTLRAILAKHKLSVMEAENVNVV